MALLVVAPLSAGCLITHLGRAAAPEAKLGAPHENVSFSTADGLTLRGWYGPPRNGAAAIEFLHRRRDVDAGRIGGLGLSVGGELMLETE